MALVAGHALMFPFKNISGQFVIEGFGVPFNQGKIFPVVFRVALGTLFVVPFWNVIGGVQTLARAQASGNFRVTAEALQSSGGTQFVAVGAVQCAVERLVSTGKRTGRNLRPRGYG